MCKEHNISIFAETDPELLQQLKHMQLVGKHAKNSAIVPLAEVIKLASHCDHAGVVHRALKAISASSKSPPPQRHAPSDFGIPTIPWGTSLLARAPALPASSSQQQQQQQQRHEFPTSLPDMALTSAQQDERYALTGRPPAKLRREMDQFMEWSAAPINTERSARYVRAVQSTTLEKVPNRILGFVGYICSTYAIDGEDASLDLYSSPKYIARFVGYLRARNVGIGHIRCVIQNLFAILRCA